MASNKFEALARKDSDDSNSAKSEDDEDTEDAAEVSDKKQSANNGEIDNDDDDDGPSGSSSDLAMTEKRGDRFAQLPDIPELGKGEHQLQYPYCLWFSRKNPGAKTSGAGVTKYEDSIKLIGAFSSVEQFWAYYSFMVRPGELTGHSDIHLFKHGIRPMWEDKANKNGGKWIVRLRKGLASRCWENLILAILGEQFMVGPEVCGAVVSIRYQEDIISIWNRNASDQATTSRIRDTLRRVLSLPQNTIMEYKAHMASLTDNSSYRNTSVFVR